MDLTLPLPATKLSHFPTPAVPLCLALAPAPTPYPVPGLIRWPQLPAPCTHLPSWPVFSKHSSSTETSLSVPRIELKKGLPILTLRNHSPMRNVQCFPAAHGPESTLSAQDLRRSPVLPPSGLALFYLRAPAHPLSLASGVLSTIISYKTLPASQGSAHSRPVMMPAAGSYSSVSSATSKLLYHI